MAKRKLSLREACRRYTQRFTMEHVPSWARLRPVDHGGSETRFYAPQYRSDTEWYENTIFPGEPGYIGNDGSCFSLDPSWPLGKWLEAPYSSRDA